MVHEWNIKRLDMRMSYINKMIWAGTHKQILLSDNIESQTCQNSEDAFGWIREDSSRISMVESNILISSNQSFLNKRVTIRSCRAIINNFSDSSFCHRCYYIATFSVQHVWYRFARRSCVVLLASEISPNCLLRFWVMGLISQWLWIWEAPQYKEGRLLSWKMWSISHVMAAWQQSTV